MSSTHVTVTSMMTREEFLEAAARVMKLQDRIDRLAKQRAKLTGKALESLPLPENEFGELLDKFDEISRKIRILSDELAKVTAI